MATIREQVIQEALARLQAPPNAWIEVCSIRRTQKTIVTRQNAPRIHLVEGDDKLAPDKGCRTPHEFEFTVSLFFVEEDPTITADVFLLEVVRRLNPNVSAWENNVTLDITLIRPLDEIADEGDALRLDVIFRAKFATQPWQLDVIG